MEQSECEYRTSLAFKFPMLFGFRMFWHSVFTSIKNNQQIGTMKGIPLEWNGGGGRGPSICPLLRVVEIVICQLNCNKKLF